MIEYSNSQIARVIDEYVHNRRDREVLKARYIDGICYEPLSERFGLSVRQVKNIVYKHEQTILDKLN
jgi:DNA-directed RNA polymerase specialized sigma24 family protein